MTGTAHPAAAFGSDEAGDFRVLSHHPDFPPEAVAALRSLGRSVSFRGGRRDVYPPSYALWPADGGLLVARVRDAGDDAYGRPHRLHVDAAWVGRTIPPPTALARLLTDAAWPDAPDATGTIIFRETDSAPGAAASIAPGQRVFVAGVEGIDATGFDVRVDAGGTVRTIPPVGSGPEPWPVSPKQRSRGRMTKPLIGGGFGLAVIVTCASVVYGVREAGKAGEARDDRNRLENEIRGLRDQLQSAKAELDRMREKERERPLHTIESVGAAVAKWGQVAERTEREFAEDRKNVLKQIADLRDQLNSLLTAVEAIPKSTKESDTKPRSSSPSSPKSSRPERP